MLKAYAKFICRYPWPIIGITAAITIGLGLGIRGLHVSVDPDNQLPQDHPYVRNFHRAHDLFGDWNMVVIALEPKNGDISSSPFLEKFRTIVARISTIPGCNPALLQSAASPNSKFVELDHGTLRTELILPEPSVGRLTPSEFHRRLHSDPAFIGTIVSEDFRALAIYATFELSPLLPGYFDIQRQITAALEDEADGSFAYALSGPIPIVAAISEYSNQIRYYLPFTLLIIALLHYIGLRSAQSVALPLLTGLLAVTWTLGLMGHLEVPLDPLNSTTAILVLAISAGHAVQILRRYQEEYADRLDRIVAIENTLAAIGGVTLATGLIAAVSFFSLAAAGTNSMRSFGVFTGFGILAAVAIEMSAIPSIRALLPEGRHRPIVGDRISRSFLAWTTDVTTSQRGATLILASYAALLVGCAILSEGIEIDTSLKRAFRSSDPILIDDDYINQMFAGTNSLVLLIDGQSDGAITRPDSLLAILKLQEHLEQIPGVGKTVSIADTVAHLHTLIGAGDGRRLPSSEDLAAQYLLLYELSGGNELGARLTPDHRTTKILILLHDDSTQFASHVIAEAGAIATRLLPSDLSMSVAGSLASTVALSDTLVRGKIANVIQIWLVTMAIAALFLRSVVGGVVVGLPVATSVLFNFATMRMLGISLDISTAAVSAMSVGIGADYALYFVCRFREESRLGSGDKVALQRTIATSRHAIILVSSAVAAGFSVLCLSGFRMLVQLGGFVAAAMVTSSLSTILIVPSAITLLTDTRRALTRKA
jgi:predicted RND superfamily exporter protein